MINGSSGYNGGEENDSHWEESGILFVCDTSILSGSYSRDPSQEGEVFKDSTVVLKALNPSVVQLSDNNGSSGMVGLS